VHDFVTLLGRALIHPSLSIVSVIKVLQSLPAGGGLYSLPAVNKCCHPADTLNTEGIMFIVAAIFIVLLTVMDIFILIGAAILGEPPMRDSLNDIPAFSADEAVHLPAALPR
jgi:hypothetical protein